MSDSSDSVNFLQMRAMQEVAKRYWGDFVLFDDPYRFCLDFLLEAKDKIIAHHKTVIERISKSLPLFLPKILFDQLVQVTIRMHRGYQEALICTEQLSEGKCVKLSKTHPLTSGPYSAKNFIDLTTGHFDELAWAKRFVSDETRSVFSRFELACHYCFDDKIRDLWCSTISQGWHPYEGEFYEIARKSSWLVAVWVCQLENKFGKESEFANGFYVAGFIKARTFGFEYASRFFWARCSNAEKANLMNRGFTEDLILEASMGYAGFVNFIYSLLSLEQKRNLIESTIKEKAHSIWTCLLLSPFYEPVLNDMLTIPFPTSNKTFAFILAKLISAMLELPLPEYKEIFQALWKPLLQKQQIEILEMKSGIIENLTQLKDMELLETVIRPFPPDVKERMLLYNKYNAGISALSKFSKEGDYDAVHRYMLLFFLDRDPVSQMLSMREDATDFLDRFTSGDTFVLWSKEKIPESERRELSKVLENLQGILCFLYTLQYWVEMTHSDRTGFLSLRR